MGRYKEAKVKIAEKHGNVPIEIRAREAALERMRKGRNEIESYHGKVFQERSVVVANARSKRQADIDEYKRFDAQTETTLNPLTLTLTPTPKPQPLTPYPDL